MANNRTKKTERRDSISRKDLLKYIRPNFEGLSLRNIESLQEIILAIQEGISQRVENNNVQMRTHENAFTRCGLLMDYLSLM